jgi:hypothetical protein
MEIIREDIVLRYKDTELFDVVFKYLQQDDKTPIDVSGDTFYIYIKSNTQSSKNSYKFNTTEHTTNLFIENENELHWSHGNVVNYTPDTYTYFIKRVSGTHEFTELQGTLIVEPEVVQK